MCRLVESRWNSPEIGHFFGGENKGFSNASRDNIFSFLKYLEKSEQDPTAKFASPKIPDSILNNQKGEHIPTDKEVYIEDYVFAYPPFSNINNMKLTIRNIHIRYEDDQFTSCLPIAIGLLIDELIMDKVPLTTFYDLFDHKSADVGD